MEYHQAIINLRRGGLVHPFYLLSGPEDYLKEEFLQELLKLLEKRGRKFLLERLDGRQVNLAELMTEIKQLTLFSGGRLFWVSDPLYLNVAPKKEKKEKDTSVKKGFSRSKNRPKDDPGEKELFAFLQEKTGDAVIIFSVQEVDRRKKLVKAAEEKGMHIYFNSLKGAQLKYWIKEKFSLEGKKIEEQALDELVGRLGENLYLQKKEIEKIVTYMGEEKIVTLEIVQYLVPESRQGNIFNLVKSVGHKNMEEAFYHLHKLYLQNEHPLVILAMLSRQFRLLYQFLLLQEKGLPPHEMAAYLKVQPFVVKELAAQAGNYNRKIIADILPQLKETDLKIKTGLLEAHDALEQLILNLSCRNIQNVLGAKKI